MIDYGVLLFVLPRKEKTPEHDDEDEDLTTVFVAAAIIVVIVALFIFLLWPEGASAVAFAFVWAMERMARLVTALIGIWARFLNEIWNPGSR